MGDEVAGIPALGLLAEWDEIQRSWVFRRKGMVVLVAPSLAPDVERALLAAGYEAARRDAVAVADDAARGAASPLSPVVTGAMQLCARAIRDRIQHMTPTPPEGGSEGT